jgi:hypothetical protein
VQCGEKVANVLRLTATGTPGHASIPFPATPSSGSRERSPRRRRTLSRSRSHRSAKGSLRVSLRSGRTPPFGARWPMSRQAKRQGSRPARACWRNIPSSTR